MSFTDVCFLFLLQNGKVWSITTYILSNWLYGQKKGYSRYDFFLAWTHLISSERIYIYWSQFGKLGYKLVVLGKTGLQIAHSNKVRGQRFWCLKHCWFQIVTKVIRDKYYQWWSTSISIFLLEVACFSTGVQEDTVN